ncbi:MAG: tetratricopeptide repeat protein, partial [Polyangiaceae bacterium]
LEKTMARFPNDGLAHRALTRLSMHIDEVSGRPKTIAWLEKIAPSFAGTELEQAVAFDTAKRIDASGDTANARARYIAIADKWPYPHGAFWDDSLYGAAIIDEKNKAYDEAIADLERMLAERETASMIGSYERPLYEPAAWKIAEIYRDDLHDADKAAAAFHRVYSEFTTSLKRDDALWEEANVFEKNGDGSAACSRLSTLASKFPDSRYVPCAIAKCSDISRPSKSQAPKECPAYILKKT